MRRNIKLLLSRVKINLKIIQAKSGYLSRLVRSNTAGKLTVLAFHRVIATSDPRFFSANKQWTMEAYVFGRVIQILKRHFNFVSVQLVLNYYQGIATLPANPLLITFDDGWYDNFLYAYPTLKEYRIPALFFITTNQIGQSRYFWQEEIFAGAIENPRRFETIAPIIRQELNIKSREINILIETLFHLDKERRNLLLEKFFPDVGKKKHFRLFMTEKEIREMHENGMDFGTHGLTHEPLTHIEKPQHELSQSKQDMEEILGQETLTMSLPHGAYNTSILEQCHAAGYQLVFTSDNGLNDRDTDPLRIQRKYMPTWHFSQPGIPLDDDRILLYNTLIDLQ